MEEEMMRPVEESVEEAGVELGSEAESVEEGLPFEPDAPTEDIAESEADDVYARLALSRLRQSKLLAEREMLRQKLRSLAVESALVLAGAQEVEFLLFKLRDLAKFDEDETLLNGEDLLNEAKRAFPAFFRSRELPQGVKPMQGSTARPDFSQMTYSQMMEYLRAHPDERVQ